MRSWSILPKHQDIDSSAFVSDAQDREYQTLHIQSEPIRKTGTNYKKGSVKHFISHRWGSPEHPDPDGEKLQFLKNYFPDDCLIWMDYLCLPQEPRVGKELEEFIEGIKSVPSLVRSSWFCAIESNQEHYKDRAWCQFEAMCAIRYRTLPVLADEAPVEQHNNDSLIRGLSHFPLIETYYRCRDNLPKDHVQKGTYSEKAFYKGGYYLHVPDLEDIVFAELKNYFFNLDVSNQSDLPILWSLLREIFPPRRLDFTSHYF